MSDNKIRIKESVEELDDLAATESSRAKLNRLAVLKLYALFVRSGEREPVPAIARSVGVAEETVRKWLEIYSRTGISGLLSGNRRGVGALQSRKRTSQEGRKELPDHAIDSGTSVPPAEPAEGVARDDVESAGAATEVAIDGAPAHDEPEIDTEPSIVLANVADRYRLLVDEIEDDNPSEHDPPETTRPSTTRLSFKDELRLRTRAGRRAIGRATKRLLRKRGAAQELRSATSTEGSLLPEMHPPPTCSEFPVEAGTDDSSGDSTSDLRRAVRQAPSLVSSTYDPEAFAKRKGLEQGAGGLNGAWVLVAETDGMIASIIRHRLEKHGANVVVAPDGMEVVSTLWRRDFDLLVTGVALPGLDGFEITRWVRDSARHTKIPVMVMSWPGNESDLVRAFDAGADDFVYKPFSPVELITRLKRLRRNSATGGGATASADAA